MHDQGKWVCDLDLTRTFRIPDGWLDCHVQRLVCRNHESPHRNAECQRRPRPSFEETLPLCTRLNSTSIDNWDELPEPPETGIIYVRAHKNWLARLSLTRLCMQLGFRVIILPSDMCWPCCAYTLLDRTSPEERIALIY